MSHFLKSFIVCSVLLNLLLAGVVLGNAGRYFVKPTKGYTWQEIEEALPADTQPAFQKTIEQAERDTQELHRQLKDKRKKFLTILKTEPFDRKACLAQLQEVKDIRVQIMQKMIDAVSVFAEDISPEGRAKLAEMLHYPPRHEEQQ